MAENNLTIQVGADTSKLRVDLAKAQDEVKQLGAALRGAAKEANETGDDIGLRHIAAEYDGAVARANALKTRIREVGIAHEELRGPLGEAGEALGELREHFNQVGESVNVLAERNFPYFKEILAITLAEAGRKLFEFVSETNQEVFDTSKKAEALGLKIPQYEALGLVAGKHGLDNDRLTFALAQMARTAGQAQEQAIKLTGVMPTLAGGVDVVRGSAEAATKALGKLQSQAAAAAPGGKLVNAASPDTGVADAVPTFRGAGASGPLDTSNAYHELEQLSRINITKFPDTAEGHIQRFGAIGEALDKLGQSYLRNSIAQRIWGRSYINILPVARDFGKQLREAQETLEKSKLTQTPEEQAQAAAFVRARATMLELTKDAKEIIGTGIGQAFTPVFDEITKKLLTPGRGDAIRKWANETGQQLAAVARDFIALFNGADTGELKTDFVKNFVAAWRSAKEVAQGAAQAFREIKAVLDGLAATINFVTGGFTHFNGVGLGIVLVVGQMAGFWKLLATGIRLAWGAWIAFRAVATPEGIIALGGSLAGAARSAAAFTRALVVGTVANFGAAVSGITGFVAGLGRAFAAIVRLDFAGAMLGARAAVVALGEAMTAIVAIIGWPALIVAGLVAAGVAIYVFRDKIWTALKAAWGLAEEAAGKIKVAFIAAWNAIADALRAPLAAVEGFFDELETRLLAGIDRVLGAIKSVWNALSGAAHAVGSFLGGGSDAAAAAEGGGFAGGGYVRGPGTATSDSVPARLSAGEYVMRAAAVSRYGAGFMDALNSGRAAVAGFALGGLVLGGAVPAYAAPSREVPLHFAAGGIVPEGGGRMDRVAIDLSFGGATHTLEASRPVAKALLAEARGRQMASGGRKPSWKTD